jgi:peptide/nickel transport system ATP-binding protein
MSKVLQVRDLHVGFQTLGGAINAVNGISFDIGYGETVALVGESGSGKSVTAQAILGILPRAASITGGEILFSPPDQEPVDLARLDPASKAYGAIRGDRISIIFQEPMTSFSPLHTIGDQISEALLLHRDVDKATGREASIEMLRLVGFPDPVKAFDTYPFELSGGLRQRGMIAMALVCRPALLIADEPTTALDVTVQAQVLGLIKDLQAEFNMAVLLITHDLGVVANVADHVVVAYRGRVMEAGTLNDIFERPQHPYLKALLNAVPHFDMKPGERLTPIREIKLPPEQLKLIDAASGEENRGAAGSPLIEVHDVVKRFAIRKHKKLLSTEPEATIMALNGVSLTVNRGECLGLVGESGCGKTTLSKVIMRAIDADSGAIVYHGEGGPTDLLDLDAAQMEPLRRKMQYVFQDPFSSLNPRMTVGNIVCEPLLIHNIGTNESRRETTINLLRLVGLGPEHMNRYPHSFSGGQRQRIGIARALALSPEVLICDEPVSALDVSIQAQILNLLKDLQDELGLTYIFISHNLAVVDYIADRIAVMCAGNLVELAPREVLFRNPIHPYTKALMAAVPYPDPNRPLDFAALKAGRMSDPAAWPAPFAADDRGEPDMISVSDGHFVRSHAMLEAA